jgi:hypothetical protein
MAASIERQIQYQAIIPDRSMIFADLAEISYLEAHEQK